MGSIKPAPSGAVKAARADRQAARATLQAAEASLARALANVRDVEPLPDATVKEKLERAAEGEAEEPEGEPADDDEPAPVESPGLAEAARQRRGADEQWVRLPATATVPPADDCWPGQPRRRSPVSRPQRRAW